MGPDHIKEGVQRHAPEPHSELRPARHTVDVAFVHRRRQLVRLLPAPAARLLDQAVDTEGPLGGCQLGCDLGGQDWPVVARVVLAGRQRGVLDAWASGEASGDVHTSGASRPPSVTARGSSVISACSFNRTRSGAPLCLGAVGVGLPSGRDSPDRTESRR